MSTRDDVEYDGIQVNCHDSGLDFALVVGSSPSIQQTTQTCCIRIHVIPVGKLPHSVGAAYNGHFDNATAVTNGNTYAPSTSRKISRQEMDIFGLS